MGSLGQGNAVPVIDLSLDSDAASQAIRQACIDFGFFYITNAGIPVTLVEETFEQSKAFFSLPLDEKMKVLADSNNRGYTPMEEETLDPSAQKKGDTKEGYYIGREVPAGSPGADKPLHGPNQWPDPALLPNWRRTMELYFSEMHKLGLRLTTLIGLTLGLPPGYFEKPGMFDQPMLALRLLHYSAEKSQPEDGILGAGAHSDYGMLTLLKTDDVPGLQICLDKTAAVQEWVDVPPIKGAFIVNLGDMLERWSNNLFRSTLHRVVGTGHERYSIPFFFEPNFDCLVECLPQCCDENNPARYPPTTSGQHLLDKYRKTHAGYKG